MQDELAIIQQWFPLLIKGASVTISVALVALAISLVLGTVIVTLRLSRFKLLSYFALFYTSVVRGIPELVLMLLVFYGGQQLLNNLIYGWYQKGLVDFRSVDISPFIAGSVTIGIIYSAYMAETFRGAILAIPCGQTEAATAYGLSAKRTFFSITLPQMIRHALPGIGNNWMVMLKATAIVSLISLQDLVKISSDAAKSTGYQFTFYLFAGAIFLVFTTVSILVFKWLEIKYRQGFIR